LALRKAEVLRISGRASVRSSGQHYLPLCDRIPLPPDTGRLLVVPEPAAVV